LGSGRQIVSLECDVLIADITCGASISSLYSTIFHTRSFQPETAFVRRYSRRWDIIHPPGGDAVLTHFVGEFLFLL
jgi:hypothetical protein